MSLISGQLDEIAPGVRRLVARNPGYMTGPGTNTYLLGTHRFAVIDPGADDPVHIERILEEIGGATAILATHTHPDHSPASALARQEVRSCSGAARRARPAGCGLRSDARARRRRRRAVGDLALRAIHTPGHASNHLCYLLEGSGLLFTGDHLMQGSTVVIAPPDGNMKHYLASLARLQREPVTRIAPGHGAVIEDAQAEIARLIAHRLQREAKVVERLRRSRSRQCRRARRRAFTTMSIRVCIRSRNLRCSRICSSSKTTAALRATSAADAAWWMKD